MQFVILPPVTSPGINIEEKKINDSEFGRYAIVLSLKYLLLLMKKKIR